jgi:hypothetical protein
MNSVLLTSSVTTFRGRIIPFVRRGSCPGFVRGAVPSSFGAFRGFVPGMVPGSFGERSRVRLARSWVRSGSGPEFVWRVFTHPTKTGAASSRRAPAAFVRRGSRWLCSETGRRGHPPPDPQSVALMPDSQRDVKHSFFQTLPLNHSRPMGTSAGRSSGPRCGADPGLERKWSAEKRPGRRPILDPSSHLQGCGCHPGPFRGRRWGPFRGEWSVSYRVRLVKEPGGAAPHYHHLSSILSRECRQSTTELVMPTRA